MGLSSILPFGDSGPATIEVDDMLAEDLYERSRDARLQTVRPYTGTDDGLVRSAKLLNSLHDPTTGMLDLRNGSAPFAFELHYSDDTELLQPRVGSRSSERFEFLERQFESYYDESDMQEVDSAFLDARTGRYVAGTTLSLRQSSDVDRLRPVKNFRYDSDYFDISPFKSIGREMVGSTHEAACDVLVQTIIKPAVFDARWDRLNWWYGIDKTADSVTGKGNSGDSSMDWEQIGREIAEPFQQAGMTDKQRRRDRRRQRREREREDGNRFTGSNTEEPRANRSPQEQLLDTQKGMRGHHFCIRIIAVSDDPEVAKRRVANVASTYSEFDAPEFEQGFEPSSLSSKQLYRMVQRAAGREYTDQRMVFSTDTLAGVCQVPANVTLSEFDYSLSSAGKGVPPRTPRFDFEDVGLSSEASRAEKQVAMLDNSGPGDPFWLGFGSKHGTEVGVYEDYLDAHMMLTGGTRKGKTTTLTNVGSQVFDRDYGALVVATAKEDEDDEVSDEDRFIEEWPEGRPEEDFVFIDTGDEFEKRVRFNLLEIPTDAEPGTNEYESAIQTLAEDWAASFAEAGGGDTSYWGALMDRITRTVITGLSKQRSETCTPLDIAAAVSSSEGLEQFSQWMDEERIAFVRQAAQRIAEKEDADLEPLAGRTDLLTQHAGLREFLCARDPTASIQEFVREGKVCVLRLDPHLSKNETRFMLTPLMRRFATAKRTLPDSPRFYLLWDEFDKGISPLTNVHELLSISGGYGFRMILACQAPSNQLYDELKNALQNQVDTAVSYGTGEKDAQYIRSHHSFDSADPLTDVGRHKHWLRTYWRTANNEDKTYSYKVDGFQPARDARQEIVADDERAVDVEGMKRRSVERYGDVPKSAEELKEESPFHNTGTTGEISGPALPDELDMDDRRVWQRALKATFDESIRQDDEPAFVTVEDAISRLRQYLPGGESIKTPQQAWRKVYQNVADECIAVRDQVSEDGEEAHTEVKALDTSFMNVGDSTTAGGKHHQDPMVEAYVPFTQLGFVFDILDQDGDSLPDALATLDDALYLDDLDADAHDQITERVTTYREEHAILDRLAGTRDAFIESEHSTGNSQPSQTVSNLVQAHNQNHRCLFLCRPEDAAHLHDVVAGEEPCCTDGHSEDGEKRFYTLTPDYFKIDDEEITRPGAKDNVWVYDEQTGQYILRDNAGTVHARFDTAADIYTDASAYPDDGDRGVKPPIIPEYEFDGGDPSAAEWDIITVPRPPRTETEDGEVEKELLSPADLELYREDAENTPLSDMIIMPDDVESNEKSREQTATPDSNTATTPDASDGSDQSAARATDGGSAPDEDAEEVEEAEAETNSEPASEDGDSGERVSRL
ncbi:hypothetical protein [Halococcus salifodinae]|uniref:DUF8128 domain-containing protein n=1 Tax=Halococcus salifodinae DSM 8989 TaxID=1227456 RepID=M0MR17_9EURY|nr:hypothetical protein [Halococcus salifodinae]EMA47803.1 hypothetical protein C450_20831 [Halococcus salifodinae DSM 8989]